MLSLLECAKLFELASFLQCKGLIKSLEMALSSAESTWRNIAQVDAPTAQYIYDNFDRRSACRDAAVKLFCADQSLSDLDWNSCTEYPQEFLWDVAVDRDSEVFSKEARIRTLEERVKKAQDKSEQHRNYR